MRRERAPLCLLVVLQLCPAQVPSRIPACPGGAYAVGGDCCSPCPPGAAAQPCGPAERSLPAERCRPAAPRPCGSGPACAGPAERRRPRSPLPAALRLLKRAGPAPAAPNATDLAPPAPEDAGRNIIPVYCSMLAAVVVGLLAYVAFKCWQGCRQKRQLGKARAGEPGPAPDGEKLHGDGGLDGHGGLHGLQEPPGSGLSALAPSRREELERLLESGGEWRALAARLGYDAAAVGTFGRGQAPARTLLAAWAAADGATLEALAQALVAIGRRDAAERLAAPADASSLV